MLKLAIFTISFTVVALPSMIVFATSGTNGVNDNNILEVMRSIPYFSLMVLLIETAQIETLFQDESTKMTVFVPINNAFFDDRTDLMIHFLTDQRWKLHLRHFLKHHMFHKEIDTADIVRSSNASIETLTDELVTLESYHDGGIVVNSVAKFVEENVITSNGAIQAIDKVLVPTWHATNIADLLELDPIRFSTLVSFGNKNADFIDVISSSSWEPYTIFAPTNKAFSDSEIFDDMNTHDIQNLLCYHVVPGIHTDIDLMQVTDLKSSTGQLLKVKVDSVQRTLTINGNLVIQSNILANNGVMHVIDSLLVPSLKQVKEVPIHDTVDILTSVQSSESYVDLTEPICGCSSCPVSCGARVQWLKNNEVLDEASACSKVVAEKSSTLDCEKCDPSKCSSNPDLNTTATLLLDEQYNKCLLLKKIEENRGASEVKCSCQQLGDGEHFFELVCRGEFNTTCSPKYAECDTNEHCCSNPLRRCKGGQCRDALRPPRNMHGTKIRSGEGLTLAIQSKLFDPRKTRNEGRNSSF
jgi:transforming growth factor-beta-induced protein